MVLTLQKTKQFVIITTSYAKFVSVFSRQTQSRQP